MLIFYCLIKWKWDLLLHSSFEKSDSSYLSFWVALLNYFLSFSSTIFILLFMTCFWYCFMHTPNKNVYQQICCVPQVSGSHYFHLLWSCFLHWLFFCLSQFFDLNAQTLFNCSSNVSTVLIKFTWSTFFCASFLDSFCFFDHENGLMQVQIHLTSFI